MKQLLLALTCLLLLIGCGEPRTDARTPQQLDASVRKLQKDMSSDEALRFARAIQALSKIDPPMEGILPDPRTRDEILMDRLHGKTVAEIYDMVEQVNRDRAPYRLRDLKDSATESFHDCQRMASSYRNDAIAANHQLEALGNFTDTVDRQGNLITKDTETTRLTNLVNAYRTTSDELEAHADVWRELALWLDDTRDIDEAQQRYDEAHRTERRIYDTLSAVMKDNETPAPPAPEIGRSRQKS